MTDASSLNLVRDELESTLKQVEIKLEDFLEERSDSEALSACLEYLQQIRGALELVEVSAARMLADEMVELLKGIPADADHSWDYAIEAVSTGVCVLARYFDYMQLSSEEFPELLIPTISLVRQAQNKSQMLESHFFQVKLSPPPAVPQISGESLDKFENNQLTSRCRQMYQVGLIDFLREANPTAGSRLMSRALWRIYQIFDQHTYSRLWWIGSAALEAFADRNMTLNPARKQLFGKVDRCLRDFLVGRYEEEEPEDDLLKELLYLLSISDADTKSLAEIKKAYKLVSPPYNDQALNDERLILSGPGHDVFKSLSKVLKEEVFSIKESLALLEAETPPASSEIESLNSNMGRLGKTLMMVGMHAPGLSITGFQPLVKSWQEGSEIKQESLLKLADVVLYVESCVINMEYPDAKAAVDEVRVEHDEATSLALCLLREARIVVSDESRAGIAQAKRAITAYIESGWDKAHLVNVPPTLTAVHGGLYFMDMGRPSGVLEACSAFINEKLLNSEEQPTEQMLETLADILTSLEYFLEGGDSPKATAEVLDLADQGLAELGYEVKY